jgi:hypothetical protein
MNQVKTGWGEIASHMCPVSCEQIHGVIYDEGEVIKRGTYTASASRAGP